MELVYKKKKEDYEDFLRKILHLIFYFIYTCGYRYISTSNLYFVVIKQKRII